ncbi:hypothetical protein SH661x_001352 [Planctomicrobium sp. SH661]|uniref:hypothetical protein n=1 Tax=Planctomicrobium sp. SH661 TaxID=3448124 RepID=UPI003F5C4C20
MLLLLPLIAMVLSPGDVSRYGLFASALAVFLPLATQNIPYAGERLAFDYLNDGSRLKSLNWTLLSSSVVMTMAACSGLIAVALGMSFFGKDIPIFSGDVVSLVLFAVIAVTWSAATTCQTVMRVHGRALAYSVITVMRLMSVVVIFALSSLIFVWLKKTPSFNLLMTSFALGNSLSFIASYYCTKNDFTGGAWNLEMFKASWNYAAPTSVQTGIGAFTATSGRWVGVAFIGLDQLAEYTLASMLLLVASGFARSCIEGCRPEIMKPFAEFDFQAGRRQAFKAVGLGVAVTVAFFVVVFAAMGLILGGKLGEIRVPPINIAIAGVAALMETLSLYGMTVLLGLKQSRIVAGVSAVIAAVSLIASMLACMWKPSSESLILSLVVTYFLQMIIFNVMAARRLASVDSVSLQRVDR